MPVYPHTHRHDQPPPAATTGYGDQKLLAATFINVLITAVEVAGGILSGSLALLSDALHNLGDGVAVFIAYLAHRISKRRTTIKRTFGYKRIEIMAALVNSVILVAICIFLISEAIERFRDPAPVKGFIMFLAAAAGMIANLVAVILLKPGSKKNINIRAAYMHLLGDTLSSVAVILGGILIHFFDVFWLDPLITLLISLYILRETYEILRESINILMQATPKDLDLKLIKKEIEKVPEIVNVHHIHAWNLNDQEIHFEGHVDLRNDISISETQEIRHRLEILLKDKFKISHTTLQFEFGCCEDKGMISSR